MQLTELHAIDTKLHLFGVSILNLVHVSTELLCRLPLNGGAFASTNELLIFVYILL